MSKLWNLGGQTKRRWVVKDRKQLVLEGRVDGHVLVVQPYLLRVFSEDSLLFCGQRPCWDVRRTARVRQEDEGGPGYACILFEQEDQAELAVLASAEVALNGRRVCLQELMCLLDGDVVQLDGVFGE